MNRQFIQVIQQRTARAAIGPSSARGQGATGVVEAARRFASELDLASLRRRTAFSYLRRLDELTVQLMRRLPADARSWGLARKLVNLFIRDCVYDTYLRRAYGLQVIESLCEVPLDSITAKRIRGAVPTLPRWNGVKYLRRRVSAKYQTAAQAIAAEQRLARVHLDAYWFGARR